MLRIDSKELLQKITKLKLLYPNINTTFIKKDILIDTILNYIKKIFEENNIDSYAICGGTCLSKFYFLTNRLSEDIDLCIYANSNNNAKNKIQTICKLFKEKFCTNIFVSEKESMIWEQQRNYATFSLKYENEDFSIDLKGMDNNCFCNQNSNINNLKHSSLFDRLNNLEQTNEFPCLDLNTILIDKLLAFHNKFSNEHNRGDEKRIFRHLYDVYYIVKNLKIDKKLDTFKISQMYYEHAKLDKLTGDELKIENNSIFYLKNEDFKELQRLIQEEVYIKENRIVFNIKNFLINFKNELISI